jgi:hypothetical protein
MRIGLSVLLIASGWILLFTLTRTFAGVSINIMGLTLIAAGGALLLYDLSARTPTDGDAPR